MLQRCETPRAPRPDLVSDDRGAIMVVGVMFTFLWIGLAWFIFGIGNAIAYRENLQNAADAGAFAAAVYDARGMNIIAMINIVMGVALAILVAAKVIQAIIFVAEDAACWATVAACSGPQYPVCIIAAIASCKGDCGVVDSARSTLETVDSGVHDVLEVCHYLEVGLAIGWPWVAAGKSTAAGNYYSKGVPLVTSFSYSQIPYSADTAVGNLTDNFINFSGSSTTDTGDTETRYGLPVSSEQYSNLCKVAIIDCSSLGGLASGSIPGFIAGVLDHLGEWLCDAGADKNFWSKAIYTNILGVGNWAFPFPPTGLPLTCAEIEGRGNELPLSGPDIDDDNVKYSPMKLYSKATMGLDYFGIWSTAIGAYTDQNTNKKLQVAGQQATSGNKVVADLPYDVAIGVTRAEFYYDPKTDESGSGAQTDETTIDTSDIPMHNVMWNMRWRARLRRYHYFPGILGDGDRALGAVLDLMNQGVTSVLTTVATDALNGMSPNDIMTSLLGQSTDVSKQDNTPASKIYH